MRRSRFLSFLAGGALLVTTTSAADRPDGASDKAFGDTTRVVQLPEVVSTANRLGIRTDLVPSPVYLIEQSQLQLSSGHLLSSSLLPLPGVTLKTYGGGSSLQTISMRGMSPENTLILIDGIRINNPQNGQVDLGFLIPANVDRIEVAPGGFSSLYGSDAVGGVVNIITRKPPSRTTAAFEQSFGSAGLQGTRLSAGTRIGDVGLTGNLRRETGRGNYRFLYDNGTASQELERNGNDFRIFDAEGKIEWRGEEGGASFTTFYNEGKRGIGAAVTTPATMSRERLEDRSLRFILTGDRWISDNVNIRLSGHGSYAEQTYEDPGFVVNGEPYRSGSITRYLMVTPEIRYEGGEGFRGVAGAEFARAWLKGVDLLDANRHQQSAFVSAEQILRLPFEAPFEIGLYPSLRYDNFTDAGSGVSPRFGVNVGLLRYPSLRLRGSVGRSFRVPSFNDLYWAWGGNPELKPERSTSFDVGATSSFNASGEWRISATLFRIASRDRILWIPSGGLMWIPRNVGEVVSKGFEGEIGWRGLDGMLDLSVNSTWTDATKRSADYPGDPSTGKQLVYVPSRVVKGTARFILGGFSTQLEQVWCGRRYTTEVNDKELPSYATTSAAVRYELQAGSASFFVKGEVANIFGESYQVIASYPMPLREFRFTMGAGL